MYCRHTPRSLPALAMILWGRLESRWRLGRESEALPGPGPYWPLKAESSASGHSVDATASLAGRSVDFSELACVGPPYEKPFHGAITFGSQGWPMSAISRAAAGRLSRADDLAGTTGPFRRRTAV